MLYLGFKKGTGPWTWERLTTIPVSLKNIDVLSKNILLDESQTPQELLSFTVVPLSSQNLAESTMTFQIRDYANRLKTDFHFHEDSPRNYFDSFLMKHHWINKPLDVDEVTFGLKQDEEVVFEETFTISD